MEIIITESQYIKLLVEKNETEIANIFTKYKNITNTIFSDVKKQYKIDFTFLGTWGSVIGGFIGPISEYMSGKYANLSETDITLISFGIILTFFSSNTEKLQKVLKLIKEKQIVTFFDIAIMKAYDLKNSFLDFLSSLNLTMSKVSNMIAYAFLIPLMPILKNVVDMDLSEEQIDLIVIGVSHYTGLSIGAKYLKYMIEEIINRFRISDNNP